MDPFVKAFADLFSWASGFTFEVVYTAIIDAFGKIAGWPFHWGTGAA